MTQAEFPSGASSPAQTQNAPRAQENVTRIISIPEAIAEQVEARREVVRIQGEVIRADAQLIEIRTERGIVEVKPQEVRRLPSPGSRVEVEVQPNRQDQSTPPREATYREVPRETAPPQRQSATPVDVTVSQTPAPHSAPPVEERHQSAQKQTQTPPLQNGLPSAGSVVRLQALTTQIAASNTATRPPEILQQVLNKVAQTPVIKSQNLIETIGAQNAEELQALLKTPNTLRLITAQSVQALPQQSSILETTLASSPAPTPATAANNVFIATTAPQTVTAPHTQPAIMTPETFKPESLINLKRRPLPLLPPTVLSTANPFLAPLSDTPATAQKPAAPPAPATPFLPRVESFNGFVQNTNLPVTQVTAPAQSFSRPVNQPLQSIAFNQPVIETANPYIQNLFTSPAPTPQTEAASLPASLILQNQNAGSITGVVSGIPHTQLPSVSVVFPQYGTEQVFALQFPSENVAIGTQIQIVPHLSSDGGATATTQAPATALPLSVFLAPQTQWPIMDEVYQTLARIAPQVTQSLANVTPSPANAAQFGTAVMFFVAAVRGGDLSQWLGQKAGDLLKAQKSGKTLNRLMGEGQMLSRITTETLPQDWRALNIPLLWQNDVQKVALYFKHERGGDDNERSAENGTRFVFDLALDNMGNVQLDGLYRPVSDAGKRLDLVLRTQNHFAQSTQAEMRRVFARALRETQITGELSFQNAAENWVTIHAENERQIGVDA